MQLSLALLLCASLVVLGMISHCFVGLLTENQEKNDSRWHHIPNNHDALTSTMIAIKFFRMSVMTLHHISIFWLHDFTVRSLSCVCTSCQCTYEWQLQVSKNNLTIRSIVDSTLDDDDGKLSLREQKALRRSHFLTKKYSFMIDATSWHDPLNQCCLHSSAHRLSTHCSHISSRMYC
jgi:hypothetical protein